MNRRNEPAAASSPLPDFRLLFEAAPGAYLVLAPDLHIVAVSNAYLQATMTQREAILGRGLFEVFPDNPDDAAATGVRNLKTSLERVLQHRVADTMAVQKYDIRRTEAAGGGFEARYWSPVNSPVLGADNEVAYIIHRVDDVTEFVRLKQRETEQQNLTQSLLSRGEQMEAEIYLRAQAIQESNRRLEAANEQLRLFQTMLEQRVHERTTELEQANENLRLLIDGVKDYAIFMLDRSGRVISWNTGAERVLGYKADEILGQSYARFFPRAEIARGEPYKELDQAALLGHFNTSSWRVRKDGTQFWADGILTPLYRADGEVRGFAKITRDLTERHRLDLLLRSVLDHTADSIICLDDHGRIELFNEAAELGFGYTQSEVIGQSLQILMPEPYFSQYNRYLNNYLATGEATIIGTSREVTCRRKDGSLFPAQLTVTEFQAGMDGSRHFTGVFHDLTEQRKLEIQLHQSQKMEAFGQLAGGVAHDFNNLLTIINGYSELIQLQVPAFSPVWELVREIGQAGERAAALTRQLLAFSRKQVLEPKVLNLNSIVAETERLLRRLIGEDISVSTVLDPALGRVRADPGQVEQVLMNLALNARDAMPQGGKLTVETANTLLTPNYTQKYPELKPGAYVLLAVSDTGTGMDEATKARVFEPFFTTKEPGKGTGLGLATVFGIVKQSEGHVAVYSELGHGTTFKVYLPCIEAAAGSAVVAPPVNTPTNGSETLLLAEDEPALRALTRLVLEMHGYKVLEADNVEAALRLAREFEGTIDLLVTDVVMPGMSGRLLAERLVQVRPTLKVLYLSGYTDDAVVRHGILQAETAFLQKPFTPESLAQKVRSVLDR